VLKRKGWINKNFKNNQEQYSLKDKNYDFEGKILSKYILNFNKNTDYLFNY